MSKKILLLYYTQSGQLEEILENLCAPLKARGHTIDKVRVYPENNYPFPWKGNTFFAVMPDCVLGVPTPLREFSLPSTSYDLVILGYQAWFLSPSIPCNSMLNHAAVKAVLKNTPVVTVTGARNMWISAMERIRATLRSLNARHAGNIALVDRHANLVSFITIFYWMMTAKKDRFLNLFPPPGVSKEDIENCRNFGETIAMHLSQGEWNTLQDRLLEQKAVEVRYNLMFIESKARKIFRIWAGFISKRKNKDLWLSVFKYYIMIALFLAAPVILTVDAIFFKPFLSKRIQKQKLYYSGVN